jgi:ISXO2-like transposase domain
MAFAIMCASKKGVSALQLQRQLGLGSYQSAWHMTHRVRYAMSQEPLKGMLVGTVEVDETYVGGKPRPGSGLPRRLGRGTRKTPVVALVERGGRARSRPIERVDAKTLKGAVRENVNRQAAIMTDEWRSYQGLDKEFEGGHHMVRHSAGEYWRDGVGTNTVESYFALLKRGVMGSFHHVSKQPLHRYCDEFSFRWSYRKVTDGERTDAALRATEGRRLSYKKPVG